MAKQWLVVARHGGKAPNPSRGFEETWAIWQRESFYPIGNTLIADAVGPGDVISKALGLKQGSDFSLQSFSRKFIWYAVALDTNRGLKFLSWDRWYLADALVYMEKKELRRQHGWKRISFPRRASLDVQVVEHFTKMRHWILGNVFTLELYPVLPGQYLFDFGYGLPDKVNPEGPLERKYEGFLGDPREWEVKKALGLSPLDEVKVQIEFKSVSHSETR